MGRRGFKNDLVTDGEQISLSVDPVAHSRTVSLNFDFQPYKEIRRLRVNSKSFTPHRIRELFDAFVNSQDRNIFAKYPGYTYGGKHHLYFVLSVNPNETIYTFTPPPKNLAGFDVAQFRKTYLDSAIEFIEAGKRTRGDDAGEEGDEEENEPLPRRVTRSTATSQPEIPDLSLPTRRRRPRRVVDQPAEGDIPQPTHREFDLPPDTDPLASDQDDSDNESFHDFTAEPTLQNPLADMMSNVVPTSRFIPTPEASYQYSTGNEFLPEDTQFQLSPGNQPSPSGSLSPNLNVSALQFYQVRREPITTVDIAPPEEFNDAHSTPAPAPQLFIPPTAQIAPAPEPAPQPNIPPVVNPAPAPAPQPIAPVDQPAPVRRPPAPTVPVAALRAGDLTVQRHFPKRHVPEPNIQEMRPVPRNQEDLLTAESVGILRNIREKWQERGGIFNDHVVTKSIAYQLIRRMEEYITDISHLLDGIQLNVRQHDPNGSTLFHDWVSSFDAIVFDFQFFHEKLPIKQADVAANNPDRRNVFTKLREYEEFIERVFFRVDSLHSFLKAAANESVRNLQILARKNAQDALTRFVLDTTFANIILHRDMHTTLQRVLDDKLGLMEEREFQYAMFFALFLGANAPENIQWNHVMDQRMGDRHEDDVDVLVGNISAKLTIPFLQRMNQHNNFELDPRVSELIHYINICKENVLNDDTRTMVGNIAAIYMPIYARKWAYDTHFKRTFDLLISLARKYNKGGVQEDREDVPDDEEPAPENEEPEAPAPAPVREPEPKRRNNNDEASSSGEHRFIQCKNTGDRFSDLRQSLLQLNSPQHKVDQYERLRLQLRKLNL